MTVEKIIQYLVKNQDCLNPNVIRGMLQQLQVSDNLDLSFVTATKDQILIGYNGASSTGTKVEGAYVPLNTSDADATKDDIREGKTAYVNGVKITGELVVQNNQAQ